MGVIFSVPNCPKWVSFKNTGGSGVTFVGGGSGGVVCVGGGVLMFSHPAAQLSKNPHISVI